MRSPVTALPLLAAVFLAGALCVPAHALDLTFPGEARETARLSEARTSFRLPVGPFVGGSLPTELTEGTLDMAAYRVTLATASTLDLMQALRAQVLAAGFKVMFECETMACGGFDFRYGMQVLPEPDMHVDLGDFRYLAARKGGTEVLALMVSRSGLTGFVQVTQVGDAVQVNRVEKLAAKAVAPKAKAPDTEPVSLPAGGGDLLQGIEIGLAMALDDLEFTSGSSTLVEGDYATLTQLAGWLKADARRIVTLVGHTDASGGLASNVRLSKMRAESVRQHLLFNHKIAPEQIRAEGVGSLAPRDSNLTEAGRTNNRRVEVMVTSTELLMP